MDAVRAKSDLHENDADSHLKFRKLRHPPWGAKHRRRETSPSSSLQSSLRSSSTLRPQSPSEIKEIEKSEKIDQRGCPSNDFSQSGRSPSPRGSTFSGETLRKLPPRHENPLGLNVVYEPERAPSVDIVFVHGLGGTSRHTWSRDKDSDRFWPEQWLPNEPDICTARVLSFGYHASGTPTGPGSVLNITDFAKNLLFSMRYGKDEAKEELNIGKVRPDVFKRYHLC